MEADNDDSAKIAANSHPLTLLSFNIAALMGAWRRERSAPKSFVPGPCFAPASAFEGAAAKRVIGKGLRRVD